MPQIFISHSSQDAAQSVRLHDWLRAQGFHATFLDFDTSTGIAAGANWEKTLYRELSACDAVLLILTANWFASKWCFVEFAQARALGKTIIPLIETPTGETLVSSDIQHLDLVLDRNGGLDRLRAELTRISLNTRGGFPWDATRSPFPGLLAFDQPDAAIYFGRDDEIRRLIERLNARRAQGGEKLVAVLGASGAGKSSLVRAGVLPRLARDPRNWIVLPPFRPQLHPLEELAQSIANALQQPAAWKTWRTALSAPDPGELHETLSDLSRDLRAVHHANEAHILLSIDQAEELFTASDDARTSAFFRVLNALLDDRLPFLAVLTLRSDFLGRLQSESRLTVPFEQFSLKPMPFERVREIILGPARVANLAVDDALVSAAVSDARTEDALPLLAFALRELYDRSAGTARLTLEAYRALGDPQAQLSPLENAVRRKADEVLAAARPSPEALDALKQAFIPALVRIDAQGDYVRRASPLASIPPLALPLIERLSRARLLTILDENGAPTVEVAHEALLRKWPLLRDWLDDERDFIVGKDRLAQDLADWTRTPAELQDQALLTGVRLTLARTWLIEKPQQLTTAERSYVEQSIYTYEAEVRRQQNLQLEVAQNVRQAGSRRLAHQALQDIPVNPPQALLEAVQAAQQHPTVEAEVSIHAVLAAPRQRQALEGLSSDRAIAFSADGKYLATIEWDGRAYIWSLAENRRLLEIEKFCLPVETLLVRPLDRLANGEQTVEQFLTNVNSGAWTAEERDTLMHSAAHQLSIKTGFFTRDTLQTVSADPDGPVTVWSLSEQHLRLVGHTARVIVISLSPDGRRILTGSADGTARLWEAINGTLVHVLPQQPTGVETVAFYPYLTSHGYVLVIAGGWHAEVVNADTGVTICRLIGHSDRIIAVAFSPDGERLLTGSVDGTARLWNSFDGQCLAVLPGDGIVSSVSFSPVEQTAVTGGSIVRLWDIADGRLLFAIDVANVARTWSFARRKLGAATLSPTEIFAFSDGENIIHLADSRNGVLLGQFQSDASSRPHLSFSPDGLLLLALGEQDNAAYVFRCNSPGSPPKLTLQHAAALPIHCAAFSPDGDRIVTASADKTACIWDVHTGDLLLTLGGHTGAVILVAFSPDGTQILTSGSDDLIILWSALDGRELHREDGPRDVRTLSFSGDGNLILVGYSCYAFLWELQTWETIDRVGHHSHREVAITAFSPDDQTLLTASFNGVVRVWTRSGDHVTSLTDPMQQLTTAVFSPDSRRILTAGSDGMARLWQATDGRLVATFAEHTGRLSSAVFSSDGSRIVTTCEDGIVRIYEIALDKLVELAKSQIPSTFQESQ